jgi:hypothetical protein
MRAAGAGGVIKGRAARTVAGEKAMAKMGKRGAGAAAVNRGPSVNNAAKAEARVKRATDNLNRNRYASISADRHLASVKSAKALKAARKAQKSHGTAARAMEFLKGTVDSGSFRRGTRYKAGNRERVAATYSVSRVSNAFRAPKSRLVAPPKGVKIGRRIAGSGNQIKGNMQGSALGRPSGTIRRR